MIVKERYFILRDPGDENRLNSFLEGLEAHMFEYETDYEFREEDPTVLINVRWEE